MGQFDSKGFLCSVTEQAEIGKGTGLWPDAAMRPAVLSLSRGHPPRPFNQSSINPNRSGQPLGTHSGTHSLEGSARLPIDLMLRGDLTDS